MRFSNRAKIIDEELKPSLLKLSNFYRRKLSALKRIVCEPGPEKDLCRKYKFILYFITDNLLN